MALQMDYSTDNDDYTAAYYRIDEVNTHYADERGRMVVNVYKSRAAANNKKRALGTLAWDFQKTAQTDDTGAVIIPAFVDVFWIDKYSASKTDPKKLGYLWLKTLPMFANAVDVV